MSNIPPAARIGERTAGPADTTPAALARLCEGVISAEADCFERWCQLMDGRGRVDPGTVVESQTALHRAAEQLRCLCLANPAIAEAARQDLMREQVEGEIRYAAEIKRVRSADARDGIRGQWNTERWHIFQARDALTVGLGWPHRGESVVVHSWYYREHDAERAKVPRPGIYLYSHDTGNVTHLVWLPQISARPNEAQRLVGWEPCKGGDNWGNADPAGDIGMRVTGAEERCLPVPLPRWPKPEDIEGGLNPMRITPVGGQLGLCEGTDMRTQRGREPSRPGGHRARGEVAGQLSLEDIEAGG
jgi:hypothetical protein